MTERSAERPTPVDDLEVDGLSEETLEAVSGGEKPGPSSTGSGCCSCWHCSNGE